MVNTDRLIKQKYLFTFFVKTEMNDLKFKTSIVDEITELRINACDEGAEDKCEQNIKETDKTMSGYKIEKGRNLDRNTSEWGKQSNKKRGIYP